MTLKSYTFTQPELTYRINVTTEFSAVIPNNVNPGTYTSLFLGTAVAVGDHVKFSGVLSIEGYNVWVRFVTDKPKEVVEGFYSANGTLLVTIQKITFEELGITWVIMRGKITHYGEQNVSGGILAHGKIGYWFHVQGGFVSNFNFTTQSPIAVANYSICQFVLKNYTDVEVNYEGKALYVEGYWNVYNVTVAYFNHELLYTKTLIVEEGYGQLNVTLSSQQGNFTLQIEGINTIKGDVIAFHEKYRKISLSKPAIPISDLNGDWEVNILDVIKVARAFGSMVGKKNYSFNYDFNMDFVINIYDLVTVARDYGTQY